MIRGLALGLLAAVTLAAPASADDRPHPHLHYSGTTVQADGTPFPSAVFFPSNIVTRVLPGLAPPDCHDPGPGRNVAASSAGRYDILVGVLDTPACVAAMQTFTPPPAAFPDVTSPGWIFRRQ